jgi:exopolysaccharide biosynthesis polyprenyl glycosylphosphotransferase
LGKPEALPRVARILQVDEIIVAREQDRLFDPELHEVLLDCRELGFPITPLSEVYENLTARYPVSYAKLDPALILSGHDTPMFRLYNFIKRIMDVCLALMGMLALGLLSPIVALANLTHSPGSLFFRQQRIGKGGKPFVIYKFRSMIPNAEHNTGAVWSHQRDPRITPIGRWLRRTRLDELPQVINVIKGEMSIVGPRPERPEFVGELMRQLPIYRARHFVKPGITGWAQVRFSYGSSVEDARIKLEYDLYYIKHQGVFLDLLILLKTLPAMLFMKGR